MLTAELNEKLTRVGPGTPMGNLMRRYWVPALLSWEVPEPDSPPVEVRVLGENLVAFRDTEGRVGLVSAYCAHRRVSLFWGRNEESGLRCVYHGWKFDVTGACIDMPSEPQTTNFKDKVTIPAYPTYEAGGVVWAYMGPPEKQPSPPDFQWTKAPPERRAMSKVVQENNWLQALEGGIDTVHVNFLHAGRPPGKRYDDSDARGRANNFSTSARIEVIPTDYGYTYAGIRDMGDGATNHVRVYHWVMPWNQIRQTGAGPYFSGHMWVPVDDYNTMVYNWDFLPDGRSDDKRPPLPADSAPWFRDARLEVGTGNSFVEDIDPTTFQCIRNAGNRYEIDRRVQQTETYTGIRGINTQDRAVQESMGGIADRSLERLGTTDRAIITARRLLIEAIDIIEAGGKAPGAEVNAHTLIPGEWLIPQGDRWYEFVQRQLTLVENRSEEEVMPGAIS